MIDFLLTLDSFAAALLFILGGIAAVWLFFREFITGLLKGDKACWCNVIGFTVLALLGCTLWGWLQEREGLLILAAKFAAPATALGLIGLVAWLKPVHHLGKVAEDAADVESPEEAP